jgi:DNA-binding MarR family transcriptional regulator
MEMSSAPAPLADPTLFLLGRMRTIERAAHREMLARLHANGYRYLRLPHIAFLAHMTHEGRRLTEFAELMQVTKAAASQLVSFLEAKGLVERVPDPTDGRASLIRATPAALPGFKIARQRYAEMEDEWRELLGSRRLNQLVVSLKDLEAWAYSRSARHQDD